MTPGQTNLEQIFETQIQALGPHPSIQHGRQLSIYRPAASSPISAPHHSFVGSPNYAAPHLLGCSVG